MTETLALHFHILVPFKKIFNSNQVSSYNIKFPSQITKKSVQPSLLCSKHTFFFTSNVSYSNMMKTKNKNQISALYFTDTTVKKFTCINYKGRMRNQLPYKIMIL